MKPNTDIQVLITELRSKDPALRIRARNALVKIGKSAIPALISLLNDPVEHVRWEACKALGCIKDPSAAPSLVLALRDESMEIQWLAAEGLIALKNKAVVPLLQSLEENFESPSLRQGAHHVLHALEREKLLKKDTVAVVETLRSLQPIVSVGISARKALDTLRKAGRT